MSVGQGGFQFNQSEHSEPSRTSIKGEFVTSKPKAILVNTLRGVPFIMIFHRNL